MKGAWTGILAGMVFAVGCGRQEPVAGKGNAGDVASSPLSAPVDYLAANAAGKKAAERTASLAPVQGALQMFHAAEDRYPSRLQELVEAGFLARVPEAPPGQVIQYNPANGSVGWVSSPAR